MARLDIPCMRLIGLRGAIRRCVQLRLWRGAIDEARALQGRCAVHSPRRLPRKGSCCTAVSLLFQPHSSSNGRLAAPARFTEDFRAHVKYSLICRTKPGGPYAVE